MAGPRSHEMPTWVDHKPCVHMHPRKADAELFTQGISQFGCFVLFFTSSLGIGVAATKNYTSPKTYRDQTWLQKRQCRKCGDRLSFLSRNNLDVYSLWKENKKKTPLHIHKYVLFSLTRKLDTLECTIHYWLSANILSYSFDLEKHGFEHGFV